MMFYRGGYRPSLLGPCYRMFPPGSQLRPKLALREGRPQSAYKNLPLRESDQQYLPIVIRCAGNEKFYAIPPNTQLFGSTGSVLRYNAFSRLIVTIFARVFGIPTIGYYDDFGLLVPAGLGECAMAAVTETRALLWVILKGEKGPIWAPNTFLGLNGIFTNRENKFSLTISLTPDKSLKWNRIPDQIVGERRAAHSVLGSIIGKLGFSQKDVYSLFARRMLQSLYTKLYSFPY